jgi:hypothetical protein
VNDLGARGFQPSGSRSTQSAPSPQSVERLIFFAVFAAFAFIVAIGCGKKGPPLAPLIKLPAPLADLSAARHGNTVDLQFTLPSANTDGTHPANVARVDVYAITAPATPPLTDAQVLKLGTKVGSVAVKAPRDPNATSDPDEPDNDDDVDAPEGPGLDQGAVGRVAESLAASSLTPVAVPRTTARAEAQAAADDRPTPLLPPPSAPLSRTYVGVGVSARGRNGPLSKRIAVPLVSPPPPPSSATIVYTETAVTLTWSPATAGASPGPAGGPDVLPSTPIGVTRPVIGYNVYDVSQPASALKLTKAPIAETRFEDGRIVWGEERCYVVRTAETVGGATIESDAPPAACRTLTDTFAPAAPKSLKAVSSEGAINLIWEPNTEKDLAGYIVLRAVAPGETLEVITPAPVREPSFRDSVQAGVRFVYAVKAVDTAGNVSPLSNREEEAAR